MSFQSDDAHKVLLAGLDSAGKTSIYRKIIEKADISDLMDLAPTRGISRNVYKLSDKDEFSLAIWDLGGQEAYRKEYLQNSQIFNNLWALIYVIDIQDEARFDASLEYFSEILKILKEYNAKTTVYVLIHKFDPVKSNELRLKVFNAINAFKKANKVQTIKVVNYTTSIFSNSIDYAFDKIFEQIYPGYSGLKKEILAEQEKGKQTEIDAVIDQEEIAPEAIKIEEIPDNEKIQVEIIAEELEVNKKTEQIEVKTGIQIDDKKYRQLIDEEDSYRQELDSLISSLDSKQESEIEVFDHRGNSTSQIDDQEFEPSNDLISFQKKLLSISEENSDTSVEKTIDEVVNPLISAMTSYLQNLGKSGIARNIVSSEEGMLVNKFCENFTKLKSEFWNFIDQEKLKSYEIKRKLPLIIEKFLSRLLKVAIINDIITREERSSLNGIFIKLIYQDKTN